MQPTPLRLGTLDAPDGYSCHVWRYSPSLSRLLVKLMRGDAIEGDTLYLLFSSVAFFSGSMVWKGASFEMAGRDEVVEMLAHLYGKESAARHATQQRGTEKLYVFGDRAKILCHEALVYKETPMDF